MRLFRPASEAATSWNVLKTALQTAAFWTVLLWIVPFAIASAESQAFGRLLDVPSVWGLLVLVLSSAGGLWSGYTMAVHGRGTPFPLDTARELVTTGPYAWVRNPMAVTGLSQGVGVGLLLGSVGTVLYVLAGGLVWHFVVRPIEEADLQARFGDAYAEYREAVPVWVPRKRAAASGSTETSPKG